MKTIIPQIMGKMLEEIAENVLESNLNLGKCLPKVLESINNGALKLLKELIEETDRALLADKVGRKEEGLLVQRREDSRSICTQIGVLTYKRTYYRKESHYIYPVDEIVGISPYQRVEENLQKGIVQKCRTLSYQQAVQNTCNGILSKQTPLNLIRKWEAKSETITEKRCVPVLHIDADEDHVAMQDKRFKSRVNVPLISVYEGLEGDGQRRRCRNIFHISEYGMNTDDLWEKVVNQIEERYDTTDTQFYLHGDGASWIAKGLEWLPSATFVLDMYHKNKYIKQLLAGYDMKKKPQLRRDIQQALQDEDIEYFCNIQALLEQQVPERREKIQQAAAYLIKHMQAIAIRYIDPETRNGGATEPHVSHILSNRLSSRPKGWSVKTLKSFVPMLANGDEIALSKSQQFEMSVSAQKAIKTVKRKRLPTNYIHKQAQLTITKIGERTPLFQALHSLTH